MCLSCLAVPNPPNTPNSINILKKQKAGLPNKRLNEAPKYQARPSNIKQRLNTGQDTDVLNN